LCYRNKEHSPGILKKQVSSEPAYNRGIVQQMLLNAIFQLSIAILMLEFYLKTNYTLKNPKI